MSHFILNLGAHLYLPDVGWEVLSRVRVAFLAGHYMLALVGLVRTRAARARPLLSRVPEALLEARPAQGGWKAFSRPLLTRVAASTVTRRRLRARALGASGAHPSPPPVPVREGVWVVRRRGSTWRLEASARRRLARRCYNGASPRSCSVNESALNTIV